MDEHAECYRIHRRRFMAELEVVLLLRLDGDPVLVLSILDAVDEAHELDEAA